MRILPTNDDGINAPGLVILEAIAREISDDIWVVAPSEEQSGAGRSFGLFHQSLNMGPLFKVLPLGLMFIVTGCIPRSPPAVSLEVVNPEGGTTKALPVWEAQPISANARTIDGSEYSVQSGDTLRAIGERTGAGSETLARFNALQPPYLLRIGQKITIPAGRYHKVAAGQSGIAIARAYSVPWASIIVANALQEPFILRVGQHLTIPAIAEKTQDMLETRAAAFRLDIDDILTGGDPATDTQTAVVETPARFDPTFIWPVAGRVTQRFGPAGAGAVNDGIDIAVSGGTTIAASADGVVAFVGTNVAGYGGVILIRHGERWITAYGRVAGTSVSRGQSVFRGQAIGRVGIGAAPSLHFELRQKRTPVDPIKYLPKRG